MGAWGVVMYLQVCGVWHGGGIYHQVCGVRFGGACTSRCGGAGMCPPRGCMWWGGGGGGAYACRWGGRGRGGGEVPTGQGQGPKGSFMCNKGTSEIIKGEGRQARHDMRDIIRNQNKNKNRWLVPLA